MCPRNEVILFFEGDDEVCGSCSDRAKKSRPKVVKIEDDATSLPDSFPLPKHCCLAKPHPLLGDDVFCGRHNCVLLVELTKVVRMKRFVSALKDKTFPM